MSSNIDVIMGMILGYNWLLVFIEWNKQKTSEDLFKKLKGYHTEWISSVPGVNVGVCISVCVRRKRFGTATAAKLMYHTRLHVFCCVSSTELSKLLWCFGHADLFWGQWIPDNFVRRWMSMFFALSEAQSLLNEVLLWAAHAPPKCFPLRDGICVFLVLFLCLISFRCFACLLLFSLSPSLLPFLSLFQWENKGLLLYLLYQDSKIIQHNLNTFIKRFAKFLNIASHIKK